MSDTRPHEGTQLGPYRLGRRHPDSDPALGHIYPRRHLSPRTVGASLLVLGSTALAVLLLWPRPLVPEVKRWASDGTETVADEPVSWVNLAAPPLPAIGYPLPSTPIKGQHKPSLQP